MRMKKIKVKILIDEGASIECIETMKGENGRSLANLRVRLERQKVLKLDFLILNPLMTLRIRFS